MLLMNLKLARYFDGLRYGALVGTEKEMADALIKADVLIMICGWLHLTKSGRQACK